MNKKMLSLIQGTHFPKSIYSGKYSLAYLKTISDDINLIYVSKSFFDKNREFIEKSFDMSKCEIVLVKGEPTLQEKRELDVKMRAPCDNLIGIGGGSVMDLVKIAKIDNNVNLVIIPTTPGTGSEVSQHALLIDTEKKEKVVFSSEKMLPDVVLLEPSLMLSLPKDVLLYSMLDGFSHAIEGLASKAATPLTDIFALFSIKIILSNIELLSKGKTPDLGDVQAAGILAGLVQSSVSVGLMHSFAHFFGPKLSLPHGKAIAPCIILMIEYNSKSEVYKKLEKIGMTKDKLVSKLKEIYSTLKIDVPEIKNAKIDISTDDICAHIIKDVCTRTNPVTPSKEDVISLLRSIGYKRP